ncbi:MAG: DUF2304 domain-containing protein [Ruminococcus sp.]|nr:DUF2304 domain-containing protein [Ruminococcus sp.]
MNPVLQIFLIICVVGFLGVIIHYLARNKLNLKYSLTWLAAGLGMLILAIFPKLVEMIGNLVGIAAPVNTVFLFAGMFMLLIIFTLTMIVSHMNKRIYRLTQLLALLEKRVREMEEDKSKNTGGGY